MKRAAITIVATITGLVLLLQFKTQPAAVGPALGVAPAPAATTSSTGPSATPKKRYATHHTASASATSSSPTKAATPTTRTQLGTTSNTRYGPVQVRVTEVSGRITDVTAVQLPSGNPHSSSIAAHAAPILRQEAISADSARINVVSGATYTSDGYAQSLQSALDSLGG
jgi:uncharacterized protein with FMN-binding domain